LYISTACIRQHTSAYVSIRQISQHPFVKSLPPVRRGTRQHTAAYVSIREHTIAYGRLSFHAYLFEAAHFAVAVREIEERRLACI
jgi:hypothetical protein